MTSSMSENEVFFNEGGGTFAAVAGTPVTATAADTQASAFADINGAVPSPEPNLPPRGATTSSPPTPLVMWQVMGWSMS